MRIATIVQTCEACPSQWEGEFYGGTPFYIRFRWGYLSVRLGKVGGGVDSAVRGDEIFGKQVGGEWDGVLSTAEMLAITGLQV